MYIHQIMTMSGECHAAVVINGSQFNYEGTEPELGKY